MGYKKNKVHKVQMIDFCLNTIFLSPRGPIREQRLMNVFLYAMRELSKRNIEITRVDFFRSDRGSSCGDLCSCALGDEIRSYIRSDLIRSQGPDHYVITRKGRKYLREQVPKINKKLGEEVAITLQKVIKDCWRPTE